MWRQDSTSGATIWDSEPMSSDDLLLRDEELNWMMRTGRRGWKLINGRIAGSGEPTNAEGTYGGLGAYPLPAELPSVTPGAASETGLIAAANIPIYMPLPLNGVLAPQAYRFMVGGRVTTTATASNYSWTPRVGNANTSPSLGASAAIAKTVSITNAFFVMKGDITVQSIGAPGLNSKAWGHFTMHLNSASGGAATVWEWGSIAAASFDSTITIGANGGGIFIGMTSSAAAVDPWIVGQVHFMDWN